MNKYERLSQQAERYKKQYPPGTRIELIEMEDPFAPFRLVPEVRLKRWMISGSSTCIGIMAGRLPLFRGGQFPEVNTGGSRNREPVCVRNRGCGSGNDNGNVR